MRAGDIVNHCTSVTQTPVTSAGVIIEMMTAITVGDCRVTRSDTEH